MEEPVFPLLALQRLRMGTDGAGVVTLAAGAGCPLRCRWCINRDILRETPEGFVSAQELYERVKIDDLYFRASGGGVCFGGGESLLHAAFIRAFREICPADWKICAETSLAVDPALVRTAAEAVDQFIVDCKDWDEDVYRRYTGGDGARMKDNLRLLLSLVGPECVTVRVPLIPGCNTPEHQARSVAALKALGVTRLDVFEYVIREE